MSRPLAQSLSCQGQAGPDQARAVRLSAPHAAMTGPLSTAARIRLCPPYFQQPLPYRHVPQKPGLRLSFSTVLLKTKKHPYWVPFITSYTLPEHV